MHPIERRGNCPSPSSAVAHAPPCAWCTSASETPWTHARLCSAGCSSPRAQPEPRRSYRSPCPAFSCSALSFPGTALCLNVGLRGVSHHLFHIEPCCLRLVQTSQLPQRQTTGFSLKPVPADLPVWVLDLACPPHPRIVELQGSRSGKENSLGQGYVVRGRAGGLHRP